MFDTCVEWTGGMVVEVVANDIYFFAHPLRVLPLVVLQGTNPLRDGHRMCDGRYIASTAGASRENFLEFFKNV